MKKLAFGLILLAALPLSASTVVVQSTFDTNDEGWQVGDFDGVGTTSAPTYVPVGGNPGGYITTTDVYGFNGYVAPVSYLGNKSVAYGGAILLDERVESSDGVVYAMLWISDGITTLQYRTSPPANGPAWTSFNIPLIASAGWEIATDGVDPGVAATELELFTVLSALTYIHIDADWNTGPDQVDLDNVAIIAVPEPSTMILMGAGLMAAALLGRKRLSR